MSEKTRGGKALLRGLIGACPYCGGRRVFHSWFRMKDRCPRCGLIFDREPGWWIGAVMMNTGASMVVFGVYLGVALVLTYPSIPVIPVTLGGVALMAVFPLLFYPISRTLWLAIDLMMYGMSTRQRE